MADKNIEHALKLAYHKLVQLNGFDSVDGAKTSDIQAKNQILAAIRKFDPMFEVEKRKYVITIELEEAPDIVLPDAAWFKKSEYDEFARLGFESPTRAKQFIVIKKLSVQQL